MGDIGSVYAAGRVRVTELASGLGPDQAKASVPACPEWCVHDVVAHLTGICADIMAGNLEGVATDPWTEAQVATRRDRPLDDVLREWAEVAPQVEAMAEHFPRAAAEQWVADLTTHEHDLRGALSQPGARDSDALDIGLGFLVTMGLAGSLDAHALPALRVTAGAREWVAGGDGTAAVNEVAAPPFELFRALTGRRSPGQIRGYRWTGDPDVYLPAFTYGPFTTRSVDLDE